MPEIIIKPIDEQACHVTCNTEKTSIAQEFLINDLPELIRDITNKNL